MVLSPKPTQPDKSPTPTLTHTDLPRSVCLLVMRLGCLFLLSTIPADEHCSLPPYRLKIRWKLADHISGHIF